MSLNQKYGREAWKHLPRRAMLHTRYEPDKQGIYSRFGQNTERVFDEALERACKGGVRGMALIIVLFLGDFLSGKRKG